MCLQGTKIFWGGLRGTNFFFKGLNGESIFLFFCMEPQTAGKVIENRIKELLLTHEAEYTLNPGFLDCYLMDF